MHNTQTIENTIYRRPESIVRDLSHNGTIPKIQIDNNPTSIHNIFGREGGVSYMPFYSTHYPIVQAPEGLLFLEDIMQDNPDEESLHILEHMPQDVINAEPFVKSYCESKKLTIESFKKSEYRKSTSEIRGPILYSFNPNMISMQMLDFVVDITKPRSNISTIILAVPTVVSRAVMDYVYLITSMYKKVKLVKHANSFWFKDSFCIIASEPSANISSIRNTIGQQLKSSKEKQFTLTFDHFSKNVKFTKLIDGEYCDSQFFKDWNAFRTEVSTEVVRFAMILNLSIKSASILNKYQSMLKKPTELVAGEIWGGFVKDYVTFKEYLKLNHLRSNFTDIIAHPMTTTKDLDPKNRVPWESGFQYNQGVDFLRRGQVKLCINEIRYLIRIDKYLRDTTHKSLIVYIGSAPGIHIPFLVSLLERYNVSWIFYDSRDHCSEMKALSQKKPDTVKIMTQYFTEKDAKDIVSPSGIYKDFKIHLISDIRTSDSEDDKDCEPETHNLIFDYSIEHMAVEILKPLTANLKHRYPFIKDKSKEFVMKRICAEIATEEWLQPFSKKTSSELRLYLEGTDYTYNIITQDMCILIDEMLFHYKTITRYDPKIMPTPVLSKCNCNDCAIVNNIAYKFALTYKIDLNIDNW